MQSSPDGSNVTVSLTVLDGEGRTLGSATFVYTADETPNITHIQDPVGNTITSLRAEGNILNAQI